MAKPKVGCQPIIFGGHEEYNVRSMLEAMAEAGYDGVEAGAQGPGQRADELRRALGETGLEVLGAHSGFERLERLDEYIAFLHDFDASLLMVSGTGDRSDGAASYERGAIALNKYGLRAAGEGITLCYHNHSWEFHEQFGGERGIDILLRTLDPACVKLCVDVYWVHDGGEDPAEFIRRWGERVATVHLKDRRDGTFCEVGQGELDFPAIFAAIEPLELEWVVTEQDRTERDPAESIAMSRAYLRDEIGI